VSNAVTSSLSAGPATTLNRDSSHQRSSFARAEWKYSDKGSVWIGTGEAYKYVGISTTSNFPYQIFTSHTVNAGWNNQVSDHFRVELRWSHLNDQDSFGGNAAFVPAFGEPALANEYTWVNYDSDLVELQVNWDLSKTIHLVGGVDHRSYGAGKSAIVGFPTDYSEGASGGFLNVDWNATETLTLSAGARAENETIGGSRTSPRVAAVWNPSKASSLRAGFYSSTRSPQVGESRVNFFDRFAFQVPPPATEGDARIIPNSALQPEKVTSYELGYRHIMGPFTIDATLFQMEFKQLIAQVQQGPPTISFGPPIAVVLTNQYQNTGDAKDRGIELAGAWRATSTITAGANATWLSYKLKATDTTPSYSPSFKGNVWVKATVSTFSAYLSYQHVGKVNMEVLPVTGPANPPIQRDAINQANVNLAWEFFPGATVSVYSHNALKEYTDQGGGGPTRQAIQQPVRRESGITLGYRF
jgi:outer membrane receptor for ferrienterochelin and colicin